MLKYARDEHSSEDTLNYRVSHGRANIWEGTYRLSSHHDDIGERCDCVSWSVLTFPIKGYIQKIMTKYGIPETEVTSADAIWQSTSSYRPWEAVPWAAWENRSVLCPNQQYYGIAANVYLRAGRALIRVMIMMADSRVNQTRVVGATPITYWNQTHRDQPSQRKGDRVSERQNYRGILCEFGVLLRRY